MYKQLKRQLDERDNINSIIKSLDERISLIIHKGLGLKGTSYSDIKLEIVGNTDDKFAKTFAKVENLDKERELLIEERNIIDNMISDVSKNISKSNNVEQKVFKYRYILGLSNQQTSERLGYSIQHIKRINKEISKKMQDETFMRPLT